MDTKPWADLSFEDQQAKVKELYNALKENDLTTAKI